MKYNNILFVCAANICRSPMAEYLFKDLLKKNGVTGNSIKVGSAGIGNTHGSDASDQAIQVMLERGLEISRHKARMINRDIVDGSDLILCMCEDQVSHLRQAFPEAQNKFHLLTAFCGGEGDVDDPSGRPTRAFEVCAKQLDDLLSVLLEKIK